MGQGKLIILVDFENVIHDYYRYQPIGGDERLKPWNLRLDEVLRQIAEDFGVIESTTFLFIPDIYTCQQYGNFFHESGFFVINCPKIRTKRRYSDEYDIKDTTDKTLLRFGKMLLREVTGITHLCIGSGDYHFEELYNDALSRNIKIAVLAGNWKSLSANVIPFASYKEDGNRTIYLLREPRG